jgi:hypothetical protein
MIQEMAEACAKIYFRGKNPSLATYNIYIKNFVQAYKAQVK